MFSNTISMQTYSSVHCLCCYQVQCMPIENHPLPINPEKRSNQSKPIYQLQGIERERVLTFVMEWWSERGRRRWSDGVEGRRSGGATATEQRGDGDGARGQEREWDWERRTTTEWEGMRLRDGARGNESMKRDGMRVRVRVRETESGREWERLWVLFWKFFECDLQDTWRAKKKLSLMDSISMYKNWAHWSRFLCTKTESIGLGFYVQKPSPMSSIFGSTWTLCPRGVQTITGTDNTDRHQSSRTAISTNQRSQCRRLECERSSDVSAVRTSESQITHQVKPNRTDTNR